MQVLGRAPSKDRDGHTKRPIDWKTVKKLCIIQCTVKEICDFLEISQDTMELACREMFDCTPNQKFAKWRSGGNCNLRRMQWHLAETNASMAIFLGKQYLNQIDDYKLTNRGDLKVNVVNFGDQPTNSWSDKNEQTEPISDTNDTDS